MDLFLEPRLPSPAVKKQELQRRPVSRLSEPGYPRPATPWADTRAIGLLGPVLVMGGCGYWRATDDTIAPCWEWTLAVQCGDFDFQGFVDCEGIEDLPETTDLVDYFDCLTDALICDGENLTVDPVPWVECHVLLADLAFEAAGRD